MIITDNNKISNNNNDKNKTNNSNKTIIILMLVNKNSCFILHMHLLNTNFRRPPSSLSSVHLYD